MAAKAAVVQALEAEPRGETQADPNVAPKLLEPRRIDYKARAGLTFWPSPNSRAAHSRLAPSCKAGALP
jgi:hypothetical protein